MRHQSQPDPVSGARPRVLLATALESQFNQGIFRGVLAHAHHANWRLFCQVQCSLAEYRQSPFEGMISLSLDLSLRELARQANIPFVLAGHAIHGGVSSVAVDEKAVGSMSAEYFSRLGLEHFAFVAHGDWPFVRDRRAGFCDAVERLGGGAVHCISGQLHDRRRKSRFMRNLAAMLQSLPRPCGLLAANDSLGVTIIEVCRGVGLHVPDDIAVLGVDNDDLSCELSEVPLSSIVQPLHAIGYEAARMLHQRMRQPDVPAEELFLPPQRVAVRASSDMLAIGDPEVAAALRLIEEHAAEPIDVAWIVRQLPVARRSLERRFKALVRRTLLEQIHHVRLERARQLLAESDLGLDLVARRSGFANARWLADCFRKSLNTTPTQYRRQFRTES